MSDVPVDTKSTSYYATTIRSKPTWAPWFPGNVVHNNMMFESQCLKHPATIHNVRGPDGNWPRSPWNKSWFRMFIPKTTWETAAKPGYDAWFYPEGRTPMVGDLYPYADAHQWDINHVRFQPPAIDVLNAGNTARTKALLKVAQKKWDLGVTIAEFAQTADLVSSFSRRIVDGVDSLINLRRNSREQINRLFKQVRKHGDFYRAAAEVGMKDTRLLESIRDGWMEVQFGIKPLVYDIQDASTALDHEIFERGNGLLVVAKAGHTVKGRIVVPCNIVNAPFQTRLVCDTVASCHVSASYKVPTDGVSRLTTYGLDNAPAIFWEATRLSWMVDYALGVGDWLQSFTAANGLEYIDGSISSTQRCTAVEVQHSGLVGDNDWVKKPGTQGVVLDSGRFSRELLPHGVLPAFAPQIKSSMSLVKLANTLSALTTMLGGKPGLR